MNASESNGAELAAALAEAQRVSEENRQAPQSAPFVIAQGADGSGIQR
jgi:hypothetical protein